MFVTIVWRRLLLPWRVWMCDFLGVMSEAVLFILRVRRFYLYILVAKIKEFCN